MGSALIVDLDTRVPFELARKILEQLAPEDPSGRLRTALRPLFHDTRRPQDSPAPRIKGDLRLPTAQRARLNFAFAGLYLAERGVLSLDVTVRGALTGADLVFLETVAPFVSVNLTLTPAEGGDRRGARSDPETQRVMAARDAVIGASEDERTSLWCRTLAAYLSCGDPWTARWLADEVIKAGIAVEPEAAIVVCSAHLFSDEVHTARDFCRLALAGQGRVHALALYNLAVIELRYMPTALRDFDSVPRLVEEASTILDGLAFDEVASEFVLVRNARALYLLDVGLGEQACATLERTIAELIEHGHGRTTAHAILLNNLGRASTRTFGFIDNARARSALEESVAIDSDNPEGWLELAHFLATVEQHQEALDATSQGIGIADMFPELHALAGYNLAALGRHTEAAEAYLAGVRLGGDPTELGAAAARQFLQAGQPDRAGHALAAIPSGGTTGHHSAEIRAEVALLRLEAEQSSDLAYLEARLNAIAADFPESDLARDNLATVRAARAEPAHP